MYGREGERGVGGTCQHGEGPNGEAQGAGVVVRDRVGKAATVWDLGGVGRLLPRDHHHQTMVTGEKRRASAKTASQQHAVFDRRRHMKEGGGGADGLLCAGGGKGSLKSENKQMTAAGVSTNSKAKPSTDSPFFPLVLLGKHSIRFAFLSLCPLQSIERQSQSFPFLGYRILRAERQRETRPPPHQPPPLCPLFFFRHTLLRKRKQQKPPHHNQTPLLVLLLCFCFSTLLSLPAPRT